jgi:uncharacterized membrane protein YeiH
VGPVLAAATGPGAIVLTPLVSHAVGLAAQHGGGAVADTLACPQTYHAVFAAMVTTASGGAMLLASLRERNRLLQQRYAQRP